MLRVKHGFFFFNDTATTEIYTLSLHDALPISCPGGCVAGGGQPYHCGDYNKIKSRAQGLYGIDAGKEIRKSHENPDRKSTRLNSSHANISYAVFCLNKKITLIDTLRDFIHCLY